MSKNKYTGAIIADIHAGAFSGELLYKELKKGFIKHLKSMDKLDFVIIAGDLFDTKLSLNSDHVKAVLKFLNDLIKVCKEKSALIRIIKGTESHDNQQLDTIEHSLLNMDIDLQIINTVKDEWLFDDLHVLYIPEEYMKDQDEYYSEYLSETHDMIFGHGMVNEVAFVAKNQQSEVTMNHAPIFKTETLLELCRGPIFFGHIHKAQIIKNDFYYVGSYSRWCFGETEPKGFMTVEYNSKNGEYKTTFIENELARTFDTILIDYGSSFYKTDPNQQLERLMRMAKDSASDFLRIIFNIPEDYDRPTLLINMINDLFNKASGIKIIINNNAKEIQHKKQTEERAKELLTRYDFLFDKGVAPEDKLSQYVRIKYNKDISKDRVRDILYQKLSVKIEDDE